MQYRTPEQAKAAREKVMALMGQMGGEGIGGALNSIGAGIAANRINSQLRQSGFGHQTPTLPWQRQANPDMPMMGGQGARQPIFGGLFGNIFRSK